MVGGGRWGDGFAPRDAPSFRMKRAREGDANKEEGTLKRAHVIPEQSPLAFLFLPGQFDPEFQRREFFEKAFHVVADPFSQHALCCVNKALAAVATLYVTSDAAYRHFRVTCGLLRKRFAKTNTEMINTCRIYYGWVPFRLTTWPRSNDLEYAMSYICGEHGWPLRSQTSTEVLVNEELRLYRLPLTTSAEKRYNMLRQTWNAPSRLSVDPSWNQLIDRIAKRDDLDVLLWMLPPFTISDRLARISLLPPPRRPSQILLAYCVTSGIHVSDFRV